MIGQELNVEETQEFKLEDEEMDMSDVALNPEFVGIQEVGVDQYIDENGNVQEVVEAYDPNVEFEEEEVILDTTLNETFKVDENMPQELKEQIEKFNRKSKTINSVINGQYDYVPQEGGEEDTEVYSEYSEESISTPQIAEENIVVDNLF